MKTITEVITLSSNPSIVRPTVKTIIMQRSELRSLTTLTTLEKVT
jgi:hypothetical protein